MPKKRKRKPPVVKPKPVKRPESIIPRKDAMTYKERLALAIKEKKIDPKDLSDLSRYVISDILRNKS